MRRQTKQTKIKQCENENEWRGVCSYVPNAPPCLANLEGWTQSKVSMPWRTPWKISLTPPMPRRCTGRSSRTLALVYATISCISFLLAPNEPPIAVPKNACSLINAVLSSLKSSYIPPCIIPYSAWVLCVCVVCGNVFKCMISVKKNYYNNIWIKKSKNVTKINDISWTVSTYDFVLWSINVLCTVTKEMCWRTTTKSSLSLHFSIDSYTHDMYVPIWGAYELFQTSDSPSMASSHRVSCADKL